MINRIKYILFPVVLISMFSCSFNSTTDETLKELNWEKQHAYKFLKRNMAWHYSLSGDTLNAFETIFGYIDSLNQIKKLSRLRGKHSKLL